MKKFLLGSLVAFLAFLSGALAVEIAHLRQQKVLIPHVEGFEYERFKDAEIPLFYVGQLEEAEKVEPTEDSPEQTIYAWYSLDNYPQMPEVNMIKLYVTNLNDDGTESDKLITYSGVYTTLNEDVHKGFAESIETSFEENKLKFRTKKLKGIEYRFEGTFFKNKTSGETGEKILRGTLQKFVKGRKVAQVSGDFAFYEPYCLS